MHQQLSYEELEKKMNEFKESESRCREEITELRQTKDKYKNLFENMAQGAFYQLADGSLIDCNQALLEMFGVSREQFFGRTSMDPEWKVICEDGSELSGDNHPSMVALRTGTPVYDYIIGVYNPQKKDYVWLSVNAIPEFKQNNDRPFQVFVTLHDITKRKKADADLKQSEKRFKQLAKTTFEAIVIHDNGIVLEANEQYFNLFGYQKEELIGKEGIARTSTPESQQLIRQQIAKGSMGPYTAIGRKKDGTEFPMELRVIPMVYNEREVRAAAIRDLTEQKKTEENLRKSAAAYQNLLNNLNAGVVVHSADTSISLVNPSACKLLGLSENQILGKEAIDPSWMFLRDDNSIMPLEEYPVNRVLTSKKVLKNQIVGVKRPKFGDISWVLVNGFPVFKDESNIDQAIINFVDITEIKLAQQAVIKANEKMRLASESAHFGIWHLDVTTKKTGWDDWMYHLYGITRSTYSSPHDAWHKGVHPDDIERCRKEIKDALWGEKGFDTEFRIIRPDNQIRYIKAYATVTRDSQGTPIQMTGINYDITEQVTANEALKESEERFKALHNASFGGIAIHDKGLILECNKGLTEITGFSYNELIGMDGLKLISDDTRDIVVHNIGSGYEKAYEVKGVRKTGEEYPLRLEAKNIPYRGKDIRVVEFRDITETKQLQAQLQQAQKMEAVGRLAGGVAHDFNNMLTVIIGHAEMALEDIDTSHPLYTDLDEIKKAGERSADLTKQLLAFARKQTVTPKELDPNQAIENLLNMIRRLIGEGIELTWLPGKTVWPIKMDPSQVDQILANLCVNARDAISGVGNITITIENVTFDEDYYSDQEDILSGDYVVISVSDTGCGMDDKTLENIFEPFFTTKEIGMGTGLGLATIYGIVKQNKGYIHVHSEINNGTTFKIYLPRYTAGSHTASDIQLNTAYERGNETILLVEDEQPILRLTTLMLEKLGYNVISSSTAGEAISLAKEYKHEIHLLLTDVVMPEMNGRDLAKNIIPYFPNLKRLFMSGYTADVIAHHGIVNEGINFIQKPFSKESLGAKIRQVLDKSEQ